MIIPEIKLWLYLKNLAFSVNVLQGLKQMFFLKNDN